jgi:hypothetical protein
MAIGAILGTDMVQPGALRMSTLQRTDFIAVSKSALFVFVPFAVGAALPVRTNRGIRDAHPTSRKCSNIHKRRIRNGTTSILYPLWTHASLRINPTLKPEEGACPPQNFSLESAGGHTSLPSRSLFEAPLAPPPLKSRLLRCSHFCGRT